LALNKKCIFQVINKITMRLLVLYDNDEKEVHADLCS